MRETFLVVYDYGTGGVWARIDAVSEAAIRSMYPTLTVVRERPGWMSNDDYERLSRFSLEDARPEWLQAPRREQRC